MEKNVLEFLENSQRMYGEKTACADMNNELTYTQLMNQAKFIGSCLSLKIKPTQGDRKSTRLNSSHSGQSRMPSSA